MVATLWLISLLTTTLISASECIYASPISKYHYSEKNLLGIKDNFLTEKRTKPSLSIVNPLDVLRQRLLLEMARRQMRENTKQVELNRAILKNVGKRDNRIGQAGKTLTGAIGTETGPRTISFPQSADFYDIYNIKKTNHQTVYAQKPDELHDDQTSHEEQRPNTFYEDGDNDDFLQQLKNY